MKKFLLIILIVTTPIFSFCQARLGYTFIDVKQEFPEKEYNLETGYLEDGKYYISLETSRANIFHFFNRNKICVVSVIRPKTTGALNFYAEYYNDHYVIISSTEWKSYSREGIADINLIYDDDGDVYFRWTWAD